MEICMKSLSGQGRKSLMALFIIAVQFYGGRALCWDIPERNAQQRTREVMAPFFSTRGLMGVQWRSSLSGGMTRLLYGPIKAQEHLSLTKTFHRADAERRSISEKIKALVEIREPNRHNLALIFIPRDGWPTCHNTHFFFRKMSGLTVSGLLCQVPEHRENLSKRTDVYSVLPRERERGRESCTPLLEKTVSQSGPQTVFQLFERSGKSTLGVIVPVHSGGSRPTSLLSGLADGLCVRLPPITPTPSENIIDLDIKRGRAALNKIPCMFNSPTWFWRPDTFFPVRVSVTRWTVLAMTTS